MKFLEKIQSLPEKTRKIILWVVLIVSASIMLSWWIVGIPERLKKFQAGSFIEQLNLPNLNNIETNAQKATSTQEN